MAAAGYADHWAAQRPLGSAPATTRRRRMQPLRYLFDFASMVGIRKDEYLRLRGNNYKLDESGWPCVENTKAKEGKCQLQRILPEYQEKVDGYFDGSDNHVIWKQGMAV